MTRGSVSLVTGGASGIGRATVLRLARAESQAVRRGARASDERVTGAARRADNRPPGIALAYRSSRDEAEATAEEARRLGADVLCVQADLRDDRQVRAMLGQVEARFGENLDLLVNNAGITHWVPIADLEALTDEVWHDVLDVDLVGAFRCVRAAAPLLRAAHGMVVNVASVSGILASPTLSSLAYGAAKAGLMYLTRGLAVALAPEVRVNAVAPAFTDTAWMRDHYGPSYAEQVERTARAIPLGRVASADDVAEAIVGLAHGSPFVTGQTLVVDGGLSLA